MLLEGKNAVIYGGGGAIGGAVARAFANEGAHVHLGDMHDEIGAAAVVGAADQVVVVWRCGDADFEGSVAE